MIAVYVVFVLAMAAWVVQGYYAAKHALVTLNSQKRHLSSLNVDIETTRGSIDRLKAEQEEFKKLLFNDRDVPAFIDGLSHSAAKYAVYIMDMKTQRFSQIVIPKDMTSVNNVERRHAYEDFEDDNKKDPKVEFKDRLTLAAMPIHIKIHGTFPAIVNFLNSVENDRQLLTVSNVEIVRNTTDYPQLNCEFILKIYSLEKLKDIKT
jgi:Tfp pilus assembly protein PilO